jgi:hypothetical protein
MSTPIDIKDNKGDVIGVGVTGYGNAIGKDIKIFINDIKKDFNLKFLSDYFERHSNTNEDFKKWLEGFSLS